MSGVDEERAELRLSYQPMADVLRNAAEPHLVFETRRETRRADLDRARDWWAGRDPLVMVGDDTGADTIPANPPAHGLRGVVEGRTRLEEGPRWPPMAPGFSGGSPIRNAAISGSADP